MVSKADDKIFDKIRWGMEESLNKDQLNKAWMLSSNVVADTLQWNDDVMIREVAVTGIRERLQREFNS